MQSHGLVIGSQEKEVTKPNSKKNHKITKQNSQQASSGLPEYEPLTLPRPLPMVGDTPDNSGHGEGDMSMSEYSNSPLTPVVSENEEENMGDQRYYYAHGIRAGDLSYGKYIDRYDFDDGQCINSQTGEMEEDDVDATITPTSQNVYNNVFHVDSRPKTLIDLTVSSGLRSSITRTRPALPEIVQPQVQSLREHNQAVTAVNNLILRWTPWSTTS